MYSRRDFLKLSALFTASAALPLIDSASRQAKANPDAPLSIGYLPILDASPLLLAHRLGFFEKAGVQSVKPVLFRSWASLVEAFLSGKVNLIHALSPMSVWMRYASKAPVRALMWNHICGSALTVGNHIQSLDDLSGQTIAIPFWYSIHNIIVQQLLRNAGFEIVEKDPADKQVRLTVMPPSDMLAALASQQIAGYIVAEPFNALAEAKGIGRILRFSGDVWKDHACCVSMMHDADIEQRPEWVQNVITALVQASAWAKENRAQAAVELSRQGVQKYTPHEAEVLRSVLQPEPIIWGKYEKTGAIKHPQWQQHRLDFQPYPFESYSEMLIRLLQQTHVAGDHRFLEELDPAKAASTLFDTSFVKKALNTPELMQTFGIGTNFSRQEVFQL